MSVGENLQNSGQSSEAMENAAPISAEIAPQHEAELADGTTTDGDTLYVGHENAPSRIEPQDPSVFLYDLYTDLTYDYRHKEIDFEEYKAGLDELFAKCDELNLMPPWQSSL